MITSKLKKRKPITYISYSHSDFEAARKITEWLQDTAGIELWFDKDSLPPSSPIASSLTNGMSKCESMILLLSKSSVKSGWVLDELNFALQLRNQADSIFRIIPIRIDDCVVPSHLMTTKYIDAFDGVLSLEHAGQLLISFYSEDIGLDLGDNDIYISHGWHESEKDLNHHFCGLLHRKGFRLIGDARDQAGFDVENRIKSIMSSTGAIAAIIPHRGNGSTSDKIFEELKLALDNNLPGIVIAEENVNLPDFIEYPIVKISQNNFKDEQLYIDQLNGHIDNLVEHWNPPAIPHYVFFATNFDDDRASLKNYARRLIQRITAMPCVIGDDIRTGHVQDHIRKNIRDAFVMIADISTDTTNNINTFIESGIALGSGTNLHIVSGDKRQRPPFMFQDQQVWYYTDEVSMLGRIHNIIYPYRRRVINYELF